MNKENKKHVYGKLSTLLGTIGIVTTLFTNCSTMQEKKIVKPNPDDYVGRAKTVLNILLRKTPNKLREFRCGEYTFWVESNNTTYLSIGLCSPLYEDKNSDGTIDVLKNADDENWYQSLKPETQKEYYNALEGMVLCIMKKEYKPIDTIKISPRISPCDCWD